MLTCKKVAYINRKEALAAAGKFQKLYKNGGRNVYRCPYCEGAPWHITRQSMEQGKSERRIHMAIVNARSGYVIQYPERWAALIRG